ncbi:sugar transferase [Sanguibacter sp. HDW7]|uniref:sugar transferase n=1 Tax=Sanguibacter sp. HDW7 TaxID=2714931 RepID=UPI00140DC2DB|nr:sugar transferase [Sanguibacter sp. HDW7]QIK84272.1 sugar transferase [Sanguibacter sp. HDW7]
MTHRPYDRAKRVLDAVVGGVALVASLPVQAVVALLVATKLGRPVLFRQERPGKDGEIFELRKFRSMLPVDESTGHVTDADRLTPFGKVLRSTSLDELPSLWNVVRGDMSIVGPRPLLPSYLPLYDARQARRHEVRPGLTGLAQVTGRNATTWEERLRLDVDYVEKRSLRVDLMIVVRTFTTVLSRSGVSAEGEATMAPFTGSTSAVQSAESAPSAGAAE